IAQRIQKGTKRICRFLTIQSGNQTFAKRERKNHHRLWFRIRISEIEKIIGMRNFILCIFFSSIFAFSFAQETDSVQIPEIVETGTRQGLDSLNLGYLTLKNPMRASLYSAILPGMGQVYNGKWWKVPIVWGLLGTGTGFVIHYNNEYKE